LVSQARSIISLELVRIIAKEPCKVGEVKKRVVKTLKWPTLKEWKLTPAEVLEMQKEDPTLEKY